MQRRRVRRCSLPPPTLHASSYKRIQQHQKRETVARLIVVLVPMSASYLQKQLYPQQKTSESFRVGRFLRCIKGLLKPRLKLDSSPIRFESANHLSCMPGDARHSGPLGSSSSQHRRTPELVLQKSRASFRITFRGINITFLESAAFPCCESASAAKSQYEMSARASTRTRSLKVPDRKIERD